MLASQASRLERPTPNPQRPESVDLDAESKTSTSKKMIPKGHQPRVPPENTVVNTWFNLPLDAKRLSSRLRFFCDKVTWKWRTTEATSQNQQCAPLRVSLPTSDHWPSPSADD